MRSTPEKGITYGGDGNEQTVVRAFVDSDNSTCVDTRRSASGGAVLLGGGAIGWDPGDDRGANFGDGVRGHVGDCAGGTICPSGTGLYHAFFRE